MHSLKFLLYLKSSSVVCFELFLTLLIIIVFFLFLSLLYSLYFFSSLIGIIFHDFFFIVKLILSFLFILGWLYSEKLNPLFLCQLIEGDLDFLFLFFIIIIITSCCRRGIQIIALKYVIGRFDCLFHALCQIRRCWRPWIATDGINVNVSITPSNCTRHNSMVPIWILNSTVS